MINRIINSDRTDIIVLICAGIIGITAITTQFILIREFLSAFSGNEIYIGIVLGNWLLISGLGAYIGNLFKKYHSPVKILPVLHLIIAFVPLIEIAAIRVLRDVVFIRGSAVGITGSVVFSFAVLLPFCMLSGFYLVIACSAMSTNRSIGKVYIADSIGSIVGGLFFSALLVWLFNHVQISAILGVLNLICGILISVVLKQKLLAAIFGSLSGVFVVLNLREDIDLRLTERQFQEQEVIFNGNSPYGRIVLTKFGGQLNIIESGVPLSPSGNVQQAEETVHFAMSQKPDAKNVLLISGGYAGSIREILKYGDVKIDYVELDPLILTIAKEYFKENVVSPNVNIINSDGRRFIRETTNIYDVVIIDVPDPVNAQINRLYTREFFTEIRKILSKDGVVSTGISHYENYVSDELAKILSTVNNTLARAFSNILIIPAGRVYFIASNRKLNPDIATVLEKYNIQTRYVRKSYMNAIMQPDRLADVRKATLSYRAENRDLRPVLYYYNLTRWMSQFKTKFGLMEAAFALVFVIYLLKLRPVQLTVFSSGFTSSSLEIAFLLVFQNLFGSLYSQVAVIITCFMLGLTIGAALSQRLLRYFGDTEVGIRQMQYFLGISSFALGLFSLGIYFLLVWFTEIASCSQLVPYIGIYMITFIIATIAGFQFPIAGALEKGATPEVAGKIYGADFMGASLGALLAGTFLIPALGIGTMCFIAFAINIFCFWLMSNEAKKFYILDGGLAG